MTSILPQKLGVDTITVLESMLDDMEVQMKAYNSSTKAEKTLLGGIGVL